MCSWYPSRVNLTNGDFIQRHAEAISTLNDVSVMHLVTDKNILTKNEITSEVVKGVSTYIAYVKFSRNPLVKFYRFINSFFKLLKIIPSVNLVHVNALFPIGILALYLKKIKNIPFIISEHWTGYHHPNNQKISILQKFISKTISKEASYICPVSDDLRVSMQNFGLDGNYKIVPNVVDTNLFTSEVKQHKEKFKIIHISNLLDRHKNISGMLEVAKNLENKIPDFEWKFVGGEKKEYQKKIDELELNPSNLTFIPHISHPEMVKHLQQSDVFVLFSNYENLPCVILESFSCGVAVISTDVGGIKEFFPDSFGHLIPKNGKDELLNKLIEVYQNPNNISQEMHQYAIDNFSKMSIAKKFNELYKSIENE